jgi:hypothetical protein
LQNCMVKKGLTGQAVVIHVLIRNFTQISGLSNSNIGGESC